MLFVIHNIALSRYIVNKLGVLDPTLK